MDQFTLTADVRETLGRKTDYLRAEGNVPAVVYGFDTEAVNLTLDRNAVEKMYGNAGESTVIDLQAGGKNYNVLIQEIQRDALTGFIVHADFRSIDMTKPVEATVSLAMVGEAPAVKELGGTLIQSLEDLEVKALPSALVAAIEVDVTALKTFDDVIRVSDLTAPEGMEILTTETRAIATVQAPRTAEQMAALDEEIEASVPEEEGEESLEGEDEEKKQEGEEDKKE